MTAIKAKEGSKDASPSSLRGTAEFIQAGMAEESRVGCFKVLTALFKAFLVKLEELEIPCHQENEGDNSVYHLKLTKLREASQEG